MNSRPRVSIGLPVYNGAAYLAQSIESVLGQTYGDLELVISDNASEDGTEDICRAYAARDGRVRYHRCDRNMGASANFDAVYYLSRGEFFRWQNHDDVMLPTCVEKSVAALDADSAAILCHTRVRRVTAEGADLGVQDFPLSGVSSPRQSDRFRAMVLVWHDCSAIFGLMRRWALAGTGMMAPFAGCDRALLAELALRGKFVLLDEVLFLNRDHPQRFTRAVWRDYEKERLFYAPDARNALPPSLSVFRAYFGAVDKYVPGLAERARCYAMVARAMTVDYNRRALIKDGLLVLSPQLFALIRASKRRLRGTLRPQA